MDFESIGLAIKSFDDINIHYKKNMVDNPSAIILISHGLAEHSGRYDYTVNKLNSFGYGVYRYDHRGHGLSDGRRGYLKDTSYLFEDLNSIVDLIKSENPNLPIFLLGHSIGGHSLAGFGCKYKDKVNGMVFSSPLVCDSGNWFDFYDYDDEPFLSVPVPNPHSLSHDIKAIDSYEKDSLILDNLTIEMYKALSISCDNMVSDLKNFTYPCFIVHGSSDTIVSCEDSKFFYENISSTDKELRILNGLYHSLLDEVVKDELLEEISKWIEVRLS